MHFGHLDLGLLGVMLNSVALVISLEMHFRESVSIITLTYESPQDGAKMWS
jgi:hypothetical protein